MNESIESSNFLFCSFVCSARFKSRAPAASCVQRVPQDALLEYSHLG